MDWTNKMIRNVNEILRNWMDELSIKVPSSFFDNFIAARLQFRAYELDVTATVAPYKKEWESSGCLFLIFKIKKNEVITELVNAYRAEHARAEKEFLQLLSDGRLEFGGKFHRTPKLFVNGN
ncbi:MAG: hypothetical protein ACYC5G_04485 [Candidatus Doudnabacteria bacterium]